MLDDSYEKRDVYTGSDFGEKKKKKAVEKRKKEEQIWWNRRQRKRDLLLFDDDVIVMFVGCSVGMRQRMCRRFMFLYKYNIKLIK